MASLDGLYEEVDASSLERNKEAGSGPYAVEAFHTTTVHMKGDEVVGKVAAPCDANGAQGGTSCSLDATDHDLVVHAYKEHLPCKVDKLAHSCVDEDGSLSSNCAFSFTFGCFSD